MCLLMLSLPFYINWDSQKVAQRARAHFNGLLAKHAQKNGGYTRPLQSKQSRGHHRDWVLIDAERHSTKSTDHSSTIHGGVSMKDAADGNA